MKEMIFSKERCKNSVKMVKGRNSGITLIALVLTVIVLLILAGVTIATLNGENGILTKAEQTRGQMRIEVQRSR